MCLYRTLFFRPNIHIGNNILPASYLQTHNSPSLSFFFLSFRASIRFRFPHVQPPQDLSNKEDKEVVVVTAGRVR